MHTQHVVPYRSEWAVRESKTRYIHDIKPTQKEAIEKAKIVARYRASRIIVHRPNGQFRSFK